MKKISIYFFVSWFFLALTACGITAKQEQVDEMKKNDEFDNAIKIKIIEPPPLKIVPSEVKEGDDGKKTTKEGSGEVINTDKIKGLEKPPIHVIKKPKKRKQINETVKVITAPKEKMRMPELEDSEGFVGRRPVVDPFHVGEKVVLDLSYFGVSAGTMVIETKSMVEVNGKKAYHFAINVKSNGGFSYIYSVDDKMRTFVDYETMLPYGYTMNVKETKKLKDQRNIFDWANKRATTWVKEIKDGEVKSNKYQVQIEDFSQNVFSAAYYIRAFQLKVGKKFSFRVADKGSNLIFKGDVLRREKLKTNVGTFDTVVLKPMITVEGAFKPVGDLFFWFTNDDRKLIVRIESKIKIGTIVGSLESISRGQ